MSLFSYKAKNLKGELIEGIVDAASEEAVGNLLAEKGLAIIEIKLDTGAGFNLLSLTKRVSAREKVVFFRQLSIMIGSNLPIVRSLRILVKQTKNDYFRSVISSIADEVDGGAKLSQAMAKHGRVFSDFYANIIASGETSGRLDNVMNYLADQQEKDYDLQSKVRGAMIYPAFIVSALLLVGAIMMIFVIPQMTQMLKEADVQLPLMTRILVGLSDFLESFWYLVIAVAAILIGGSLYFVKATALGKRYADIFKIKIPIFGQIAINIYIIRIVQSLGTLLKGRVPVVEALRVVKKVVGNTVYQEVLDKTIKEVDEGGSLANSLSDDKNLPLLVSQMISVGEETGRLEEILDRLSDFYSREVDNSITNLSTLIEPLIMVVLGVVVGAFVAAVIMPMWRLSAAF